MAGTAGFFYFFRFFWGGAGPEANAVREGPASMFAQPGILRFYGGNRNESLTRVSVLPFSTVCRF